jgi:hypothetical protein
MTYECAGEHGSGHPGQEHTTHSDPSVHFSSQLQVGVAGMR